MPDDITSPPHAALSSAFLTEARDLLGPSGWTDDPDIVAGKTTDWRGNIKGHTPFLARPSSTEEVAALVRLCASHNVPITPQGGNTGLVDGGLPHGELLLSLQRLNTIRSVDPLDNSLIADAGAILSDVHTAASEQKRYFPLSLGSQGICTIGGLVSTNAGGVAVLRYGMMRDLVLGLEVVTPQGEVWDGLSGLRKDNTGYDLRHLFCGAEGTLGVVTAASLKLFPVPQKATAWCAVESPAQAVRLLARVRDLAGDTVTSFELIPANAVAMVLADHDQLRDPLPSEQSWRVLIELSMASEDAARETLETTLATAFEEGLATDAVLASSLAQADTFWAIRETIPLSKRAFGTSVNHDISARVSRVPDLLNALEVAVHTLVPQAEIVAFGHLGDGNIHYGVAEPADAESPTLKAFASDITRLVHETTIAHGGSISAEHGIGRLKRADLPMQKSPTALQMMRAVKQALDPQNLMNPGRILQI